MTIRFETRLRMAMRFLRDRADAVAGVLAWVALGFAGAAACVQIESSPIARDGNLTCVYGDAVVFSGGFRIIGDGTDQFNLNGTWKLCRNDGVTCTLTSTGSAQP